MSFISQYGDYYIQKINKKVSIMIIKIEEKDPLLGCNN